jgi:hypothetical protein
MAHKITARVRARTLSPTFLENRSLIIFALLCARPLPGGKITFRIIAAAVENFAAAGPSFDQVSAALGAGDADLF